jgi:nitroreductase
MIDAMIGRPMMDAAVELVEGVLTTTRSVRRRLDLDRPVPDDLIRRCIDVAEQAPTGGDLASRRWLVIRDPEVRRAMADIYRAAGGQALLDSAARSAGTGRAGERMMASAAHLAAHLEEVPVLVLVLIWGQHDGSGNPGLFDSVLQSAWSFCLALRAHGLGSAWTTLHLARKHEVADLLGIPDGVTQVVLLPVAWTTGEFRPANRRPAEAITFYDHWGRTYDGGITVECDVEAPKRVVAERVAACDLDAGTTVELDALAPSRTRLRVHAEPPEHAERSDGAPATRLQRTQEVADAIARPGRSVHGT